MKRDECITYKCIWYTKHQELLQEVKDLKEENVDLKKYIETDRKMKKEYKITLSKIREENLKLRAWIEGHGGVVR